MFLTIVIDLEPNLFRLGPFLITWHGVFSVLGILAAARLGLWLLGQDKVDISHGAGDVTNGEHHGTPTTLPWGVQYVNPDTLGEPGKVVHPEVAYEMILTLGLLALLLPFHQRLKGKLPDGVLGLLYFGLYAFGRFFLSFYRTDPSVFLGMRQAQVASLLMVVAAVVLIPLLLYRARRAGAARDEEPAGRA